MTDKQWRDQTRRLWAKHKRAGVLMMRPWNKERTTKKWTNVYMRTLHRIPNPETCIYLRVLLSKSEISKEGR